jgi:hypothetical protein
MACSVADLSVCEESPDYGFFGEALTSEDR